LDTTQIKLLFDRYDAVVIGGGFFGCKIALLLKKSFKNILILEKETDLLLRASFSNQARVHNGYHYPRSLLTAWRSKINFPKFVNEYRDCIDSQFDKYYAVGKKFSKVNSRQFKLFCERIGIPLAEAKASIKKLFNSDLIESVFQAKEYVFDAEKLKHKIYRELESAGVKVQLNAEACWVRHSGYRSEIEVMVRAEKEQFVTLKTPYIFNCTYSSLNQVLKASNLSTIPLKHELTEMALIEVPDSLKNLGITIVCGPFFSMMPFPPRQLHTLSHVRYTPVCYWQDKENEAKKMPELRQLSDRPSHYPYTIRDAARYLPIIKDSTYIDSLWEIKTVLPQSEVNDSRPILVKHHPNLPNLISILGGKIDNIYDVLDELTFF